MNQTIFNQRRAGILAPVYALRHPSDLGIGDTRCVKEAIDFCADHGFGVLQLLPVLETIGDPSPYSPISAHALSPSLLTITPEDVPGLTEEVLATEAPESWLQSLRTGSVNHAIVSSLKIRLLTSAQADFTSRPADDPDAIAFSEFKEKHAAWLDAYTMFRVLVSEYENDTHWRIWRPDHQSYHLALNWLDSHPDAERFSKLRDIFAFIQWIAYRQWKDVRKHADAKGIKLIGDLTFGISANSCDTWFRPALFEPNWSMGTMPLAHFDTSKDAERWGQNWGFPPYRWENHRSSGFEWLRSRISLMKGIFHGCRIDHLRGYFRAYMFPWPGGTKHVEFSALDENEAAALTGGLLPRFVPGPDNDPVTGPMNELQGRELIGVIIDEAGDMDLVAEIMGAMPEYMARTLRDLQLATLTFPQLLKSPDGSIIPKDEFARLALVSYANHDNAPIAQLYLHLKDAADADPQSFQAAELKALMDFIGWSGPLPDQLDTDLLAAFHRALFSTSAHLAMLMCSDLLGIPIRFNLPGSYGMDTWNDRLEWSLTGYLARPQFAARIRETSSLIQSTQRSSHD